MCTSSGATGTNREDNELINSRCIVRFRPGHSWNGEYGFDWYRRGDYCEKHNNKNNIINKTNDGSSHFMNDSIVGKYAAEDSDGQWKISINNINPDPDQNELKGVFLTDTRDKTNYYAKELAKYYTGRGITGTGISGTYFHPWISLFYEFKNKKDESFADFKEKQALSTAKISMIVDKNSTDILRIKKIRLESAEDYIKLRYNKKSGYQEEKNNRIVKNFIDINGPFNLGQEIEIQVTLKYYIQKEWEIKAYAYSDEIETNRTLAGVLKVEKCEPKEVDILFIPVIFQQNASCPTPATTSFSSEKNRLREFLAQSLVIPKFIDKDEFGRSDNIFVCLDGSPYYVRDNNTIIGLHRKGNSLLDDLLSKFQQKYDPRGTGKYNNAYKIFFIGSTGFSGDYNNTDTYYRIAGHSHDIENDINAAVIFNHDEESTVCHELLHCFGLYHSFSNKKAKRCSNGIKCFTYKKCMTSNIMDYHFIEITDQNIQDYIHDYPYLRDRYNNEVKRIKYKMDFTYADGTPYSNQLVIIKLSLYSRQSPNTLVWSRSDNLRTNMSGHLEIPVNPTLNVDYVAQRYLLKIEVWETEENGRNGFWDTHETIPWPNTSVSFYSNNNLIAKSLWRWQWKLIRLANGMRTIN